MVVTDAGIGSPSSRRSGATPVSRAPMSWNPHPPTQHRSTPGGPMRRSSNLFAGHIWPHHHRPRPVTNWPSVGSSGCPPVGRSCWPPTEDLIDLDRPSIDGTSDRRSDGGHGAPGPRSAPVRREISGCRRPRHRARTPAQRPGPRDRSRTASWSAAPATSCCPPRAPTSPVPSAPVPLSVHWSGRAMPNGGSMSDTSDGDVVRFRSGD